MRDYDVVICGGGLVGRSLAIALAKLPLKIVIVEALPPQLAHQVNFDTRSFALSYGNALFLKKIGVWEPLRSTVTPIESIHVSDRGHAAITRLTAKEQQVPALGYIALAPDLNSALQQTLAQHENIELFCPATVTAINNTKDKAVLTVQQNGQAFQIQAKLAIAADGTHSLLRSLLKIGVKQQDYGQTAIIANLGLARHHQNIAYERFTSDGPLALLPLSEQRCGLVWTIKPEQVETVMNLPDKQFLAELQRAFGYRLGRFEKVGKRFAYPLQLLQAKQLVKSRVALIGNAAHTLHPIAGQGFNLGLRDVAVLTKILKSSLLNGENVGSEITLRQYEEQQTRDHAQYIRYTDGLVNLFATQFFPCTVARNLGIQLFNILPGIKKSFTRQAMGLSL